jgi:hypothetical protein
MYKTQTSMPMHLVGFKPAMPTSQRAPTYTLERAVTTIEFFYV